MEGHLFWIALATTIDRLFLRYFNYLLLQVTGCISNQTDAHDIKRRKCTLSLVSVVRNPSFINLLDTGHGQEPQSRRNKVNNKTPEEPGLMS